MGWFRNFVWFFRFSQREIYGVWVLFLLICVVLLLPGLVFRRMPDRLEIGEEQRAEIRRFLAEMGAKGSFFGAGSLSDQGLVRRPPPMERAPPVMRMFDPNVLDVKGWEQMGFSAKQAQVIRRYIERGGYFRRREDLRRLYVIDEEAYRRLEPYVLIRTQNDSPRKSRVTDGAVIGIQHDRIQDHPIPDRRPTHVIELNGADSLSLLSLRGIGPVFASRILRYRDRLGGFHSVEQLANVYGMDSLRLAGIIESIRLDSSLIRRIRINEADEQTLGRHPLIGYKLAARIVRYRGHHGPFRDAGDLLRIDAINDAQIRDMLPYFEF